MKKEEVLKELETNLDSKYFEGKKRIKSGEEILNQNLEAIKIEGLELLQSALRENKISANKAKKLMLVFDNIHDYWEGQTLINGLKIDFGFDKYDWLE